MTDAPVWEDGLGPVLAPLPGDATTTACVIGLGGSGLACIRELLELGVDVIGIDAGQVASGAAGRNGGFLLAGAADFHHTAIARHGHDRALRIYLLTLQQMDRMQQETPDAVRRPGSLRIAASPEELDDCQAQYDAMRADDLDVAHYEGPEGRGLLFPADGVFNPLQRCRSLAAGALENGARLCGDTAAHTVETGRVTTSRGTIECDQVFVATDGGMAALLPQLAGRVRTARLQMLATAPTRDVHLPRPVYWRYGFEYWQQLPDGRVALGGFRDTAGDAEWTGDTRPSADIQQRLERHLREVVGVAAPVTHRWAASVGFTEDGLPILDEVMPGVLAFGGYSGTGNVIGALCGRGAARHVFTGDDELVAPFLSPRRPG